MTLLNKTATLSAAAFLAAMTPATAVAQTATTVDDTAMSTPVEREDDDDFPWGILGIIGLAGLLGRKRDNNDARVDRTNTNNKM